MDDFVDRIGFAAQVAVLLAAFAFGRLFGRVSSIALAIVVTFSLVTTALVQFYVVGGGAGLLLLPPAIAALSALSYRFGARLKAAVEHRSKQESPA